MLQAETADGAGATAPAARDLSHIGTRHARRHVRARKGWEGSTVARGWPAKTPSVGPFGASHGTMKRVAAWYQGWVRYGTVKRCRKRRLTHAQPCRVACL